MLQIGIMVGGHSRGSNMQAIIDACVSGEIRGQVAMVIGGRRDAPAIRRAEQAGVHTSIISPKQYENDSGGYEAVLLTQLREYKVGLICLAGYMRMLPESVVKAYRGRIMNVHPALLPFFGGKGMYGEHVHRAVIDSGMKISGCTVHFVDEEYDTGPIIVQSAVPIEEGDTPETLAARILPQEHRAYVMAIKRFAEGRLSLDGRRVYVAEKTHK
jgi:phosphoribosylglycinamide formyltransferase-1